MLSNAARSRSLLGSKSLNTISPLVKHPILTQLVRSLTTLTRNHTHLHGHQHLPQQQTLARPLITPHSTPHLATDAFTQKSKAPHTPTRRSFAGNMRDAPPKDKRGTRGAPVVHGVDPANSEHNREMKMLAQIFPDKKITPYDPRVVAIREQIRKDGMTLNKDGNLVMRDGTVLDPNTKIKRDSLLAKVDKKFGGSWFVGRLSPWQIAMVVSLICGFVYAGKTHRERTELLPQKLTAKPMIDFVRTTTLIKYVWTLRLMLELGVLIPLDGSEQLQGERIQEEIEQELSDAATGHHDAQKEAQLARKLKEHPEVKKNLNYIEAIHILDNELHDLDKELRQSLLDLMEIYVSLGRPYADCYDPSKQSVDAIYTHSQSTISLPDDIDPYLNKHERMKDSLQVLFTRQNSAHRHYGQMFSDVYALTHLKSGIWRLSQNDRNLIPEEIKYYMQAIGYDIVRVWQDNYVHLLGKKLGKHISRLAFPSEIVDFGLQSDNRSQALEPFIRELRRVEPKVIADYNDFLDYTLNISLTDNYKRWWKTMLQNMPRFRRANDIPATITLSNYTQLFRDYERIFGKVPYLALVGKEVEFLERLKDFSLGNQDLQDALDIINNTQTTSKLERVPKGKYSVEAVVDGARDKLKELMDRDFQEQLAGMSYLDENREVQLLREHENHVSNRQRDMKRHQHTLSLLAVPPVVRTRYLYNLLDIGSPVLQIVKDHLGNLERNGIYFPLYPCQGSFRDFYQSISQAAQVLCQRDHQLVELKRQLGQVYRALDSSTNQLSEQMQQRFKEREQELLTVPDIREYALSMTREEIARDDQFIYGKTAGLFDLDEDKQKMNVFNEFEDDLTPNHPVNRGERGKIQYQIVIPDPPKHLSHAIWMLDSYVDVRPGRPDHGEDRRAFAARKFNSMRSFMPIPSRYIPQSSREILKVAEAEQLKLQAKNTDGGKVQETLAQKQDRKAKFEIARDKAQQSLTVEELHTLQQNKLERLHSIAGANLVKLEACIIQNLIELNNWGVEVRIPLDGLKPNQFKHYIQPPYSILERETVAAGGLDTFGPLNPITSGQLLPTRASLVISGKYKLLDKYHADLLKLQEQGFAIPAPLLSDGAQESTAVLESGAKQTPHILSSTEIAKSGLTPAEYYAKHQQEHVARQSGQDKQDATEIAIETMRQLQSEHGLKDFSIAMGFPTMTVDGFNDLQSDLKQQQLQSSAVHETTSSKNIQLLASQSQDLAAKAQLDQMLSATPSRPLSFEEENSSRFLLPVPLSSTNIPSATPASSFYQPPAKQQSTFRQGQIENRMPTSPVYQGQVPVATREKELEKMQAASVVQQMAQLPTGDSRSGITLPEARPYQYKAPASDGDEKK